MCSTGPRSSTSTASTPRTGSRRRPSGITRALLPDYYASKPAGRRRPAQLHRHQRRIVRSFGACTSDLHTITDPSFCSSNRWNSPISTSARSKPAMPRLYAPPQPSVPTDPTRLLMTVPPCRPTSVAPTARICLKTRPSRSTSTCAVSPALTSPPWSLSLDMAQTIICEIGTALSRFPMVTHFTSRLKRCPNNQITGGTIIRSSTGKSHNRQTFLQAMLP